MRAAHVLPLAVYAQSLQRWRAPASVWPRSNRNCSESYERLERQGTGEMLTLRIQLAEMEQHRSTKARPLRSGGRCSPLQVEQLAQGARTAGANLQEKLDQAERKSNGWSEKRSAKLP